MINILFGGTFDPVHLGHIGIAETALHMLPVESIYFIPCHQPAHRPTPSASSEDRLAMLKLAMDDHSHFKVDECEIQRDEPSYAIDTIKDFQRRFPEKIFAWLLGYDAFLYFLSWHEWEDIIKKVHLIIVNRPTLSLPQTGPLSELLIKHLTYDKNELLTTTSGKIFLLPHCHFDESATRIRQKLQEKNIADLPLPQSIKEYIQEKGLYLPR